MFEFLHSETGFYVALAVLLVGAMDLTFGWWWMGRQSAVKTLHNHPQFRKLMPFLIAFDIALVALGWYGLRIHWS